MPGASASMIARRFDVNANQLFRWRRDWREGLLGGSDGEQRLAPVRVAAGSAPVAAGGVIEIELGHGARIRVSGAVDAAALRQVLGVLSRR